MRICTRGNSTRKLISARVAWQPSHFRSLRGRCTAQVLATQLSRTSFDGDPLQISSVKFTYQPIISFLRMTEITKKHPHLNQESGEEEPRVGRRGLRLGWTASTACLRHPRRTPCLLARPSVGWIETQDLLLTVHAPVWSVSSATNAIICIFHHIIHTNFFEVTWWIGTSCHQASDNFYIRGEGSHTFRIRYRTRELP
ncbi:hypothetical protein BDM02DRAFT_2472923 [Thelephora ganbajun]|uniref:Uncharacterized protein n=1 Tax=Thelephora ganbajun TaxID=370292 RepID=A0ACB6ZET1_THEGA|nr:hypothetical protein BDM02DRAFT_2472923 [Thelephora ganbajun]